MEIKCCGDLMWNEILALFLQPDIGWLLGVVIGAGILIGGIVVFTSGWTKQDFRIWFLITLIFLICFRVLFLMLSGHGLGVKFRDWALAITFVLFFLGMCFGACMSLRARRHGEAERKRVVDEYTEVMKVINSVDLAEKNEYRL